MMKARETASPAPIRIQVAFQGGGAKIFALIAAAEALQALEKEGLLQVQRVAGTSAGSIIAALYAGDVPAESIRSEFAHFPYSKLIPRFSPLRKRSWFKRTRAFFLVARQRPLAREKVLRDFLATLFQKYERLKAGDFKGLRLPLFIVASDIQSRRQHVFQDSKQDLLTAILDSCALPFIFRTSRRGFQSSHVDGGFCANLPTECLLPDASQYGPVVAITLSANGISVPETALELGRALIETAIDNGTERSRTLPGVELVLLNPKDVGTFDFDKCLDLLANPNDTYNILVIEARRQLEACARKLAACPSEGYCEAKTAFEDLARTHPSLRLPERARRYNLVRVQYTNIEEVDAFQAFLSTRVPEMIEGSEPLPPAFEGESRGTFDAILRPELAIANEVIYTFPFFLTWLRRPAWRVIRYGWHRAVGVLVHETHPAFDDLSKEKLDVSVALQARSASWLSNLTRHLTRSEGFLYSLPGYMHNEILPLLILDAGDDDAQTFYVTRSRVVKTKLKEAYQPQDAAGRRGKKRKATRAPIRSKYEYSIPIPEIPDEMLTEDGARRHVAVVDLAERREVEDQVAGFGGYHVLALPHRLHIEVGIGFSIVTFPKIEPCWRALQTNAAELLQGAEGKLRSIGISFDPERRK